MERGERAIHSGLAYKKYTLGLPGTINELGVWGQHGGGTYKWNLKNKVHAAA